MLGRRLTAVCFFALTSLHCKALLDGNAPTLGIVFPLTQNNNRVLLSQPIWLSSSVVMPQGTQLLTIYMLPRLGDADVSRKEGHINFQRATAAQRGLSHKEDSLTSSLRQRAERTVWRDINQFRGILQAVDRQREDAFVVFRTPGEKENRQLEFNFPEGTLWSESDGIISALWVRPASPSERLGVTPGAWLLAVNGKKINNLKQAAEIWNSPHQSAPTRKTWLISKRGNTHLIDFGKPHNLQQSAIDSW